MASESEESLTTSTSPSERPYQQLSPEGVARVARHLREEALLGNLRFKPREPGEAEDPGGVVIHPLPGEDFLPIPLK